MLLNDMILKVPENVTIVQKWHDYLQKPNKISYVHNVYILSFHANRKVATTTSEHAT